MRFDLSSIGITAAAVVSALTSVWWMDEAGLRGQAQAAPVPAAHTLVPGEGAPARLRKGLDGHYWADALIEGRAVRVMVDTGSSMVSLTRHDAARLGLKLSPEDFSGTVMTAAGPARAAPVQLQTVAVAGVSVDKVEALVVERGLPHSLLGMSYLGRLSAFTATPASLTLQR